MAGIRIVVGSGFVAPYVIDDLVLALPGYVVTGEYNVDACPRRVFGDLFVDVVLQLRLKPVHERRSLGLERFYRIQMVIRLTLFLCFQLFVFKKVICGG